MVSLIDFLSELGEKLTRFTERWVPDSWIVCMILTAISLVLAVLGPRTIAFDGIQAASIHEAVLAWGDGMWALLELAMQFTIALVASHAIVTSRPIYQLLDRLAGLPNPDRPAQAVMLICVASIVTGYLNWAFTIIASALFIPFVCRRNPKADIRVLIAGAYLGVCTVWHGGLSASAPLILATPGNPLLEPTAGPAVIDRLIPVTETLFTSFNLLYISVIAIVAVGAVTALHPRRNPVTLSTEQAEAMLPKIPEDDRRDSLTPSGYLDRFPGWIILAVILILYPLGYHIFSHPDGFATGFGANWTINSYNVVFLSAALALHGRPSSLLKVIPQGVATASGIILQFPFYAGIFGVMRFTDLGPWLGQLFVSVSTQQTYPLIVYVYSGFVNLFVPSGGSKWLIEAPYLLPAARELGVSTVTTVLAYGYGDSTSNLIQPFWALPILAVTRVRFGEVLGYTFLVALTLFSTTVIFMLLIPAQL